MLDRIFLQILDLTAMGSLVIGIVLLARLFLKKQPKIYSYCLWAVVLLRLLCPVSISMPVSLLPAMPSVENHYVLSDQPIKPEHIGTALEDTFQSAVSGQLGQTQQTITIRDPDYNYGYPYEVQYDWWNIPVLLGQYVWLLGVAAMLIISLAQLLKLKKRLREAVRLEGNIYICDGIDTAFVMGIVKPKIYLPASLSEQEQQYILMHEQHHIRRFDHIFKALAFAALCLHWFNPLVWVAFVLSGRDMEMSCDEAVIKKSPEDIRADYSATLLRLSTGRTTIAGAPLAFGEGDAGKRIRNLSKWKKPVLWVSILAAVCCAVVIVLCAVNNQGQVEMIFDWETAPGKVGQTFTMPEYPGVTFRLCGNTESPTQIDCITATKGDETIPVIDGMPVRNLFLCDLNGDGKRELCASVFYGSGIIDSHIQVYDYDDQMAYSLWERMEYDHSLTMEGGTLTVIRHPYSSNATQGSSKGTMTLIGRKLCYISDLRLPNSGPAEMIFDHQLLRAEEGKTFTMPEFPGVTFRLQQEKNTAACYVTAMQNGQEKTVSGAVLSLYLADLNGDGKRELCGVACMGSGYVSQYIQVHDYAAGKGYELHDRGVCDYGLRIEDGFLLLDCYAPQGAPTAIITGNPQPLSSGPLAISAGLLAYFNGEATVIQGNRLSLWLNESTLAQLFRDAKHTLISNNSGYSKRTISATGVIRRYLDAYAHVIGDAVDSGGLVMSSNPHYTLSLDKAQRDQPVFQYLLVLSALEQRIITWLDSGYTPYVYYDNDKPDQLFVCSEFRDRGYRDIESYYADLMSGKCQPVYDTFVIRLDSHSICRWGSNENLYESLAN